MSLISIILAVVALQVVASVLLVTLVAWPAARADRREEAHLDTLRPSELLDGMRPRHRRAVARRRIHTHA